MISATTQEVSSIFPPRPILSRHQVQVALWSIATDIEGCRTSPLEARVPVHNICGKRHLRQKNYFRQTLANPMFIFSGTCWPRLVRKHWCVISSNLFQAPAPLSHFILWQLHLNITFCLKMLLLAHLHRPVLTLPRQNYQGSPLS